MASTIKTSNAIEKTSIQPFHDFSAATQQLIEAIEKINGLFYVLNNETVLQVTLDDSLVLNKEKDEMKQKERRRKNMARWLPLIPVRDEHGYDLELIKPPNSASAVTKPAGDIFVSGFNCFFVTSGTNKSDGYIVERVFSPTTMEMRWRCDCLHFARVQYTDNPYCKHIYALDTFLDSEGTSAYWMRALPPYDACALLVEYARNARDDFAIEQAYETFPDLRVILDELTQTEGKSPVHAV